MFWRKRKQSDFNAEVEAHIALEADRLKEQGLSDEEARATARRAFGNVTQAQERFYESNRWRWWDELRQDITYGLRQLRRNPGFTAVAVLTLALGIGANTAMFSVVNAVLLRPLPFRDPGRLVAIEGNPAFEFNGRYQGRIGWADWISKAQTLKDLSTYETGDVNVSGGAQPESLPAAAVSVNFFRLLGVEPEMGRTFLPTEESRGHDVAIISYDLWQARFGGERKVIGNSIDLAGQPFTIIGVMPPGLEFPADTQIWVPTQPAIGVILFGEQVIVDRQIARLKAGVTPEQARNELLVLLRHLKQGYPASFNHELRVTPLHLELVKNVRPSLLVLMGAVGLVLLIACVDVANLLMARNARRAHEITIRAAVGADRARLLRQMLTESVLLAMFGGVAGLAVGESGIRFARALLPGNQVGASGIRLDGWVLAFTFAIAVLTGVISGLLPAFGGSKVELSEELKRSPATGSTRGFGLRAALGSIEVSLALILLIGAGLLIKSLGVLSEVNPGFRSSHLVCARLFLTSPDYRPAERRREFYEQVVDSARRLAGVRDAAFVNLFPMGGGFLFAFIPRTEGSGTPKPQNSGKPTLYFSASPDYFRAMGIPLLEGREFGKRDREGSTPVVILSQMAARQLFHNQSPIGKRITTSDPPKWMTVVGIVGDVRQFSLARKPYPVMYVPVLQQPPLSAFLVLRTAGRVMRADIVRAVWTADRAEPVASVQTVEEVLSQSTAEPRFRAGILGIFAGLAVLIAAIGIYGVMAFSVTQRTHEIGIRMALGAEKRDVLKMVVGQGLKLALVGVAIGIAGALALTRFLSSLLYGVKPTDPLTFIAVSLILIAVALVACYIPARRAAKVDPMVALRYE